MVAILGLAACTLVAWFVINRESPAVVVQRFCSALKGSRYEEAYQMIDWGNAKHPDEQQFVRMGKTLQTMLTIRKYTLKDARPLGDGMVVPVTIVAAVSVGKQSERTVDVDVHCKRVDGHWKVLPDFNQRLVQDLLGVNNLIPGL